MEININELTKEELLSFGENFLNEISNEINNDEYEFTDDEILSIQENFLNELSEEEISGILSLFENEDEIQNLSEGLRRFVRGIKDKVETLKMRFKYGGNIFSEKGKNLNSKNKEVEDSIKKKLDKYYKDEKDKKTKIKAEQSSKKVELANNLNKAKASGNEKDIKKAVTDIYTYKDSIRRGGVNSVGTKLKQDKDKIFDEGRKKMIGNKVNSVLSNKDDTTSPEKKIKSAIKNVAGSIDTSKKKKNSKEEIEDESVIEEKIKDSITLIENEIKRMNNMEEKENVVENTLEPTPAAVDAAEELNVSLDNEKVVETEPSEGTLEKKENLCPECGKEPCECKKNSEEKKEEDFETELKEALEASKIFMNEEDFSDVKKVIEELGEEETMNEEVKFDEVQEVIENKEEVEPVENDLADHDAPEAEKAAEAIENETLAQSEEIEGEKKEENIEATGDAAIDNTDYEEEIIKDKKEEVEPVIVEEVKTEEETAVIEEEVNNAEYKEEIAEVKEEKEDVEPILVETEKTEEIESEKETEKKSIKEDVEYKSFKDIFMLDEDYFAIDSEKTVTAGEKCDKLKKAIAMTMAMESNDVLFTELKMHCEKMKNLKDAIMAKYGEIAEVKAEEVKNSLKGVQPIEKADAENTVLNDELKEETENE